MEIVSVDKATDKVTIADAEIVVSGGRGLKGPENWGMIEDLAKTLGAATACSKPVSDMGWRPHSEHVGQTGKPVASNLIYCYRYFWCNSAFGRNQCFKSKSGNQYRS